MSVKKGIITFLSCWLVLNASAMPVRDTTDNDGLTHHVGVNIRPSLIMPTHGFYNGWNPTGKPLRLGGSAHLQYAFAIPETITYQGIGTGIQTFLCHEYVGTPVSLYIYQGAELLRLNPDLSLGYEWNFGLSMGWVDDNGVVSSSANAYINVGLMLNYRLGKDWSITAGPEYTHFSNGDTSFPNGGANTVNFRIGAIRTLEKRTRIPAILQKQESPAGSRTAYDVTIYGAWRADRSLIDGDLELINDAFAVAGINFNPLYKVGKHLAFGPSLDLLYDRSANLITYYTGEEEDPVLQYRFPSFSRQYAIGLSVRGEVIMPIFSVNVGAGYNLIHRGKDLKGLYGIFNLKTSLTERLYMNIGYRLSSVLYSHNLMFGLGYRFGL